MWTDRQIKGFKAREMRYRVSERAYGRGKGRLVLDVLTSGQKDFYYQYFRDGVRRYVKIGSFGTILLVIPFKNLLELISEFFKLKIKIDRINPAE